MRRLRAIALALALGLGMGVPGIAEAVQEEVSLRLNAPVRGAHVPFFLGLVRGYYAEEKIALTIDEGRGPGRAVQLVAAKAATFGVSEAGTLMLGAAKGASIRAVMALLGAADHAVVSLAESGIKEAKQLEGRRIAVSAGEAATQLFPAVVAANGLDKDKITLVQVDPEAKVAAVLERKADALLGSATEHPYFIQAAGAATSELTYAALGVSSVGLVLHAHTDTLKENPDLVRRFLRATVRAFEAAAREPKAAVDAARQVDPELDGELLLNQFRAMVPLIESLAARAPGVGHNVEPDWTRTMELLKTYRDLKTDLPATAFFTNEFLPR